MAILVGIDGTGSEVSPGEERNAAYDAAFANSFVRQICEGKANSLYLRGPVALGGGLLDAISAGVSFIQTKRQQLPDEPILLTGYSRGAAGAVVIAKRLQRLDIPVRALMMFDCVDRHAGLDAEVVPNNVEHVNHVIRNPSGRSRATFGNDGMRFRPPTNYPYAMMYMCTHGGMGGTPWEVPEGQSDSDFIDEGSLEAWTSPVRREPVWTYATFITYAQDASVSQSIWSDVQPFLATNHF
jgi:hypothetical protein